MPKRPTNSWVQRVMETSDATSPPPGIFTKDPNLIADAADVENVAPKGLTSWQRMTIFHKNRSGRMLSPEREKALSEAIKLLSKRIKERKAMTNGYEEGTLLPHTRIPIKDFTSRLGKQAADLPGMSRLGKGVINQSDVPGPYRLGKDKIEPSPLMPTPGLNPMLPSAPIKKPYAAGLNPNLSFTNNMSTNNLSRGGIGSYINLQQLAKPAFPAPKLSHDNVINQPQIPAIARSN